MSNVWARAMSRWWPCLLALLAGCGEHSTVSTDAGATADQAEIDSCGTPGCDAAAARGSCDPLANKTCIEIKRGEGTWTRWLADYDTLELDDKGTARTVIRLGELINAEIVETPDQWRFKIYGTDGYTFGDYLTWTNLRNGYIELGTRRVAFESTQELPDSYHVKDAYLIVLSPRS